MTTDRLPGGSQENHSALYEEIVRLNSNGLASVLATVTESSGSAPRKVGAKMIIRHDGSIMGTIGGGRVEQEVIQAAMAALKDGRPRMESFLLTEQYGHVCGGSMGIFLEPNSLGSRLVIIGAGHIGSALEDLAVYTGFQVTVIDERKEFACEERLPGADRIICAPVDLALEQLEVGIATQIVICTTDFQQDFRALRVALKTTAGYIGMIGSKRKKKVLEETLAMEGYGPEQISRVTIPVGLAIKAETPREIAVSIIAQLIAFRRGNGS